MCVHVCLCVHVCVCTCVCNKQLGTRVMGDEAEKVGRSLSQRNLGEMPGDFDSRLRKGNNRCRASSSFFLDHTYKKSERKAGWSIIFK